MLRSKRRQSGLGDPPAAFTTNASESVNAMHKIQIQYKINDVPLFLDESIELDPSSPLVLRAGGRV